MGSVDELAEILIDFEFTMAREAPGSDMIILKPGRVRGRQTMEGKLFVDPILVKGDELLAPHVVSEGPSLKEVDGITPLWSAYQTLPLQVFWPSLPAAETGATTSWSIDSNQGNPELDRTAAQRGKLELPESWDAPAWEAKPPITVSSRFVEWSEVQGQRVAVIDVAHAGPVPGLEAEKARFDLKAHYRVLHSGRLLDGLVEMTLEFEDSERPLVRMLAEVGLEKACDGPTVQLEPFLPDLTER
jgi:hypothetical protein